MAYLSDIDLATLHKKRLDEKNLYKLSWYNRRFYDEEMSHEQQISMRHVEHKVKSKVGSTVRSTKAKSDNSTAKASCETTARASNDGKTKTAKDVVANKSSDQPTNGNRNHSPDFFDEGYYSSPTMNRRRSGTWP